MPFELKRFGLLRAAKTSCLGPLDNDLQEKLNFPDNINEIHVCKSQDNCYILRTTVKTLDEIEDFLQKWTQKSRVVWRVNKTCPKRNSAGLKNIYWKEFRCQNSNVKVAKITKRLHRKHTNCPAYMGITIKKVPSRCRSRDSHLPMYPTIIKINNNHNHSIVHQDYLKNCPVSQDTKNKFLRMYQKGHTPLSALNLHRIDLRGEYGDSIVFEEMDRSICPDNQWCYRLYSSFLANKEKLPDDQPPTTDQTEPRSITPEKDQYESKVRTVQFQKTDPKIEEIECCIENVTYDDDGYYIKTESISEEIESVELLQESSEDEDSPGTVSAPSDCNDNQIERHLLPFMELMTNKLKATPELYVPVLETFNNRLKHFDTDLDLSEALLRFGK